jgi:hypothetical protein
VRDANDLRLSAEPAFLALLQGAMGVSELDTSSAAFARLVDDALRLARHRSATDLTDIIRRLKLDPEGGLPYAPTDAQALLLEDLFHHISTGLPQGQRPPRLDDLAILTASLTALCTERLKSGRTNLQ